MRDDLKPLHSWLWSLGRNALAGAIFWIVGLALVQLGERVLGGWPASEFGQLVTCVVGVGIALGLRARIMAYVLAAMAAFSASEITIHLYYGIRAAQGAPTHFAVLGAGLLGVMLGRFLATYHGRQTAAGNPVPVLRASNPVARADSDLSTGGSERRSNIGLQPTAAVA